MKVELQKKFVIFYVVRGMEWYFIPYFLTQVYEVLKLLNELLPTSRDQDAPQLLDRESFLVNRPDLLQKFGMNILPLIIQV